MTRKGGIVMAWRACCQVWECLTAPCTPRDDNQPLNNSSNVSVGSSIGGLDPVDHDLGLSNPALDQDSFTSIALDIPDGVQAAPSSSWRPVLRFHDSPVTQEPHGDSGHWTTNGSEWAEVDLGEGVGGLARRSDSRSTTRESGYGRSLDDSSSDSQEPSVSITRHTRPDPGVFKVAVEDPTRCWFVLRRYQEFLALTDVIAAKGRVVSVGLPQDDTADLALLNAFIHALMTDPRTVATPEVREFLQLDRFRGSSSSSSDSSPPSTPTTPLTLDPRFLMPPGAPALTRRPLPDQGHPATTHDSTSSLEASIDLGCDKKSLTPSDFDFLSVVGKGSFGKVMLARSRLDDKVYAVKVLNKRMIVRRNETAHVLSERSVLIKMLNHPYLVQLHFAFTTRHKIFFVLDYVNGGELFFHLQRERVFPEPRAKFYAAEICCALTYMHTQGIVYRDLKPENILLDTEGHVVLTDFGLCKEGLANPSAKTSTFCGTPEYLAPEILKKQPYSRAVDWWTLGAVLYEMLYGLPPFYSRDTPAMYDAILHRPLRLKPSASRKARAVLEELLQKEPRDRLGAGLNDGKDVMRHDFFKDMDWDKVAARDVTPPFVPTVSGACDVTNVDPMFTREAVASVSPASPHAPLSASVQAVDHVFQGFSYAPPLDLQVH